MREFHFLALISLGIAAACATVPITGDPAVLVGANEQTEPVGTANEDAADDAAIWRNAADPTKSLIVATDKKAGLYVYGLDGTVRSFLAGGLLNNVDLTETADGTILVAASDRGDPANAKILLASMNAGTGNLTELARVDAGPGEAYGFCMGQSTSDGALSMYSPIKDGRIAVNLVRKDGSSWRSVTRTIARLDSQPEGCVVDQRTNTLYVGEEVSGIWAIDLSSNERRMVAPIDNRMLVADVEGLALAANGEDGGYLIASSQGDNSYAVYRLPGFEAVGRFRIGGNTFGATEETDGIALMLGSFGECYPDGMFVAQDGDNRPAAQNFKLVSWGAILEALNEE